MPFPHGILVAFTYNHGDGKLTRMGQPSVPAHFENKSESMTHQQNKYVGLWCVVVRQAHDFDAISAFMFYHHDFPFQFMMLSSYPSNLFLLSRRGTERDKGACPVDISSLCALHNIIASFRFKNSGGGYLGKDSGFKNLQPNWSLYQKKHAAWFEFMKQLMKQAPRIHAVIQGQETISLSSTSALLGTLDNLTVGGKSDRCSSLSC